MSPLGQLDQLPWTSSCVACVYMTLQVHDYCVLGDHLVPCVFEEDVSSASLCSCSIN